MKDEIVKVCFWNPETDREIEVTTTLEAIILNPNGYKMSHIGVALFNRERRKLGLSEYKYNSQTGTFDECPKASENIPVTESGT